MIFKNNPVEIIIDGVRVAYDPKDLNVVAAHGLDVNEYEKRGGNVQDFYKKVEAHFQKLINEDIKNKELIRVSKDDLDEIIDRIVDLTTKKCMARINAVLETLTRDYELLAKEVEGSGKQN